MSIPPTFTSEIGKIKFIDFGALMDKKSLNPIEVHRLNIMKRFVDSNLLKKCELPDLFLSSLEIFQSTFLYTDYQKSKSLFGEISSCLEQLFSTVFEIQDFLICNLIEKLRISEKNFKNSREIDSNNKKKFEKLRNLNNNINHSIKSFEILEEHHIMHKMHEIETKASALSDLQDLCLSQKRNMTEMHSSIFKSILAIIEKSPGGANVKGTFNAMSKFLIESENEIIIQGRTLFDHIKANADLQSELILNCLIWKKQWCTTLKKDFTTFYNFAKKLKSDDKLQKIYRSVEIIEETRKSFERWKTCRQKLPCDNLIKLVFMEAVSQSLCYIKSITEWIELHVYHNISQAEIFCNSYELGQKSKADAILKELEIDFDLNIQFNFVEIAASTNLHVREYFLDLRLSNLSTFLRCFEESLGPDEYDKQSSKIKDELEETIIFLK
eukprot:NODE_8_length_66115_cov_0.981823.p14 type:complete len:440 gc:universal NODE_8_length_66115_cov_0.981823:28489-27170(-)